MTKPTWWENKIGLGNIISWLCIFASAVYMLAFVQADVKALNSFREETRGDIRIFRDQRAIDREALIEMKGDLKVVRQILESGQRRSAP